jgi:hypothetical protein
MLNNLQNSFLDISSLVKMNSSSYIYNIIRGLYKSVLILTFTINFKIREMAGFIIKIVGYFIQVKIKIEFQPFVFFVKEIILNYLK